MTDIIERLAAVKTAIAHENLAIVAEAVEAIDDAIMEIQFLRRAAGAVSRGPDFTDFKRTQGRMFSQEES